MTIIEAILKINPNAKVSVNAEDYNQINWLDGTTPISKEDIEAIIPTVKAEIVLATVMVREKVSSWLWFSFYWLQNIMDNNLFIICILTYFLGIVSF